MRQFTNCKNHLGQNSKVATMPDETVNPTGPSKIPGRGASRGVSHR
ncbi:unnamed protein product [Acidithrix sp. C25]|nr:unnamed protein product [Acidithrix sp. C25]